MVRIPRIHLCFSFSSSAVALFGLPRMTDVVNLGALSGSAWPRPSLRSASRALTWS